MSKNKGVNVVVALRPGESQDKLIRRFFKKCKKTDVIKEYLEKVSFSRTKSQKRRDKILKNKFKRKSLDRK